mmetsp:Transcript_96367/g.272578  ORF Transcript_96367/g.272578 Transcript_96367/m.272578 type:complete len:176 (+) Transcript_96367:77-604(+)|eukprot:CAMPEP_0117543454 /NCGR_PEP_ID=MMETSP0784-20121206/45070_1 /TAXON_ID=39447 /ORGANISM="" /LENGTH=175 /DNA_ID=CAMNT_0005340235 /DNA_START=50 /DNA_END=577 /DNA_ORIENTATION=+
MGNCNCGTPNKVESVDIVLDPGLSNEQHPAAVDDASTVDTERGRLALVAAKQNNQELDVQPLPATAPTNVQKQADEAPQPKAPAATIKDAAACALDGVWFNGDGSHIGRLDNGYLTWSRGLGFPVTVIDLSADGRTRMVMQGEVYTGIHSEDRISWSDGDTWLRGVDTGDLSYAS